MPADIDVVLVDVDARARDAADAASADIQQAEDGARRLDELERRVQRLADLDGTKPPTRIRATRQAQFRAESSEGDRVEWEQLFTDARARLAGRGLSADSLDVLLDEPSVRRIERQFSGEFRMRTQLDRYDVAAMASAGVIAGLVDCFFVRIPADMTYPLRSGLTQYRDPLRPTRIVKEMSKLSSKHQVTIPVRILREAGLAAGDDVVIRARGHGRIEIERASDLVRRYAGSLPAGTYPNGYLDDLRGEWRE